MIYVEEKEFSRQVELLSLLAKANRCRISAWLYPESAVKEVAGYSVMNNNSELLSVTTYENGHIPVCTTPVPADSKSIKAFSVSKLDVKKNCDSLALYKDGELSWYAATIGHEGMCLVSDERQMSNLIAAGFNASTRAPSWW